MYAKILAAVNELTNSEIAAYYALALARACRAKLFLIFVAEASLHPSAFKHAELALKRLFVEAERQGIEVESITGKGEPVKKIQEIVKEQGIDLVIIATRSNAKRQFSFGTHAWEFMKRLHCSVAMVRVAHMGMPHPRSILVPLKGGLSHREEHAYFVACLAQGFNARVTLFHLLKPITSFFYGERVMVPVEREQHIPKDIGQFVKELERYGIIIHERRTGHGSIGRSIMMEAALKRNDLIVMGASERGLLRSIISGNPLEVVLRETPCNLIIFRPGHEHHVHEQR